MKKILLLTLILSCAAFLLPTQIHAQNISLGIYPPIMTINTVPPSAISQPVTVKNFGDETVTLGIELKPFKPNPHDNGEITYLGNNEVSAGNDLFIFNKIRMFYHNQPIDTIDLAPNETKTLELRVALPADEPASDYYFSILFIKQGIGNDQSNISAISSAIASNVILSVGPTDQTTGFIQEFSSPTFAQHGPIAFTVNIQNTSSHFINPKGTIVIQNMFGQYVGKLNLLPVNILEKSARFIPDDKNLNGTQAIWSEKFLLGLYKAQLTIALSDQGPLFTRTIYFFALPASAIFIGILALGLAILILVRVRKRLRHM